MKGWTLIVVLTDKNWCRTLPENQDIRIQELSLGMQNSTDNFNLITLTWQLQPDNSNLTTLTWQLQPDNSNLTTLTWQLLPDNSNLTTLTWQFLPDNSYLTTLTWKPWNGILYRPPDNPSWHVMEKNGGERRKITILANIGSNETRLLARILLYWPNIYQDDLSHV